MTTLPQTTSLQLPRPNVPVPIAPPGHGAPHLALASQGQMNTADVWRVIRTNIWLIVISVIVSLGIGFGLNWYLDKYHSLYTATGYVQIQPPRSAVFLQAQDNFNPGDANTLIVEQRTQAQMLMTEGLFTKVLQDQNKDIRNTEWFKQFIKSDGVTPDVAEAKADLIKHFSASPIGDSKLISVSMTYRIPKDCRTIVMDIVNQHLSEQKKFSSDKLVEQVAMLTNLKNKYDAKIRQDKLDTTKAAATLQLDGFNRPGGISQKESELLKLIDTRIKAVADAASAGSAYESAKNEVAQGGTPGEVDNMVETQGIILGRKQQVADWDIQIRAAQNQGAESRTIKQYQALRDATQEQLEQTRAEERAKQTVAYLSMLGSKADSAQKVLEETTRQIDKIKGDLADVSVRISDYLTKKDEQQALEDMSRRFSDQLDRLNVMLTQVDMNTIGWISQPETPDMPSFPNLKVALIVCTAVGLGLCLGICFLREMMDTSVRSPRDIARVGQMNLLGMIPHEDDDPQSQGVPLSTVIYGAPNSIMAEQFRQVRTRMQHAASLDTTRSILVTSPGPGDGKSVIACNLAAGLALNGRRILLVDANFRRPELHRTFGVGNESGFGNVLTSVGNFESCIHQTKVPNLDIMATGPKPANATELLESQLLIDFIERALEEYDHVIFDSGPMLVVSETVALAPRVDGVVTVVRASSNSRGLLQRMRDALKQLKAEHLGVVLNGVRSTGGGYYARNIKTYYEYQNGHAA